MTTRTRILVLGCVSLLALGSVRSYAGGPLALLAPGVPFLWPNGGQNIPFNPDQGGLGPLPNAAAVAQTTAAFAAWQAIPSATATHVNAGLLPVDVDETNFLPFFFPAAPDGLSAIVYDEDGAIFDLLFGPDSGVLGFAGPEWVNVTTGAIIEGVGFMNGGALIGPGALPVAEMLSVQVHEFGHYQNLGHTVVNGQIAGFGDHRGSSPFNTFPPPPTFLNRIETMYPFLFEGGGQATPHADDIAIFSRLYPEPTFGATTGTITGHIIAPNNRTPLTGVNVIARNVANPYDDAVSAISSDFTPNYTMPSPFLGLYTFRGLTPGASYAIYVDRILAGGFSTPPRVLPGPEEFYNGAAESNDIVNDVPNVFTPVAAAAGTTVDDIDIIFNRLQPGPIPTGDDTSTEIFPQFRFRFCGQSYDSFYVNANGNLTFGVGSAALTESTAALLTGPPRIAGLWDDLSPNLGGSVSFSETAHSLTVRFSDVPEFSTTPGGIGANSFSMTLFGVPVREGHEGSRGIDDFDVGVDGLFILDYGSLTATDGLAGYSCGGRIASGFEQEQDLSKLGFRTLVNVGWPATFEIFTAGDNDLDDRTFVFLGPGRFRDHFEPNDRSNFTEVRTVNLPFSTVGTFSDINPLGDDVDFYKFRAKAGDIIAIETVPGLQAMDTVIGLFDANGNLLIADDDSGVGLLSRLLVQVVVDGTYAVGVSTFPDFGFTGAGGDFGRYVLNVSSYRGTILPFENDTLVADAPSIEVGLSTFAFPFQGTSWSSVFVNSNGNLTFGASDIDFSETVGELLGGPPRIAPLWDDLNPGSGLVIAEERDHTLFIHFVSVPEFLVTGTNYFTVALDRHGRIDIKYAATNRSDGLIGVTQGAGAADPGATDLSDAHRLSAEGTTYETFLGSFGTYGGVDLSFQSLTFKNR
jgi:Bacterial pre-peptidase C-terminal domain